MVAPRSTRKVICTIVRVPALADRVGGRLTRPSDLVPWADPYIARLVHNLQEEVRSERFSPASVASLQADLEPPSPVAEPEEEWIEQPRFSYREESAN